MSSSPGPEFASEENRSGPDRWLATWVAADPKSQALIQQVRKIAESAATVLIRGESGTGKDLLASLIHHLGPNSAEPLVTIDCASLPHELMESELFGYERGAFTGANETKPGRLEIAGTGSVVLDEVAALTTQMQAKLLRVIDERRFERLGGTKPVVMAQGIRLIAITNVDLEQAVARRTFREDLFYRLNVIPFWIPPLRERPADIAPLARHMLSQLCEVHHKPQRELSQAAMAALEKYQFPGNVRELKNLLERCVVAGDASEISLAELPPHVTQAVTKKATLEELERAYIAEILDYTRGKKSKAAELLGISRKTLLEKRKRYGLD
ncbi:MAG: sigma-54 dependent transcriptional regulator [Acidobacteriales bacterium]|nr:sigma-54 dependent transcriptional regulator [Terriglobales bacterium]